MKTKTRFAPSPTGFLHLGGARTALFSWLYAKKENGSFLLRIEDTDLERSSSEAVEAIIASMKWLKLDWDEGPYFQTQRFDRYHCVIEQLLQQGLAYRCYCNKARLDQLREAQLAAGKKPRYDGCCRQCKPSSVDNAPYVVRFLQSTVGVTEFYDEVRGHISVNNEELDDLIICRSDGAPTYNFCVVIDDWDMHITHVIRGEDHINNTIRQINILKALNAPIPRYAHVSLINGEDGKKLSKRHAAVSVLDYRHAGYLPEAMLNYLLRLGWSHGDQEIFSLKEMEQNFNLEAISCSPSTFNLAKLQWLNHHYINHLPPDTVAKELSWHLVQRNIDLHEGPELKNIVILLAERCKTLQEMADSSTYFYQDNVTISTVAAAKHLTTAAASPLHQLKEKFSALPEWTLYNIHKAIQTTVADLNLGLGKVAMPLRVALTGSAQSPAIDDTVFYIGKKRVLARISSVLSCM